MNLWLAIGLALVLDLAFALWVAGVERIPLRHDARTDRY